ncbi:hypothetical protein K469DRAFT_686797 [Zopfia rhizophila CBS 207.26]|uniref:Uncharacterized protein n=1 Tax=Zopfia rhizophila CBS 207.26 TaxID=1314779 RepID=A0A6A6EXK9_9PEZI|nr:hypothetical protein K469DRAFT_686797 [Zopfia rhizophila CBS 207.26]
MHFIFLSFSLIPIISLVCADFIIITNANALTPTAFPDFTKAEDYTKKNNHSVVILGIPLQLSRRIRRVLLAASLTTNPAYSSATAALGSFIATRTDVPAIVTNTLAGTIFTEAPAWYTELPKDVKSYFDSAFAEQVSIASSLLNVAVTHTGDVAEPKSTNAAPSGGAVGYVGAGVAAAVAGVAALL